MHVNTKISSGKGLYNGKVIPPVNCSDPEMMIAEGIHPPKFKLDTNVFKKTSSEIERLKTLKRIQGLSGSKPICRGLHQLDPTRTLIVHIKNDKRTKDFKTTFRYKCTGSEVSDILNQYRGKDMIKAFQFGGIKY